MNGLWVNAIDHAGAERGRNGERGETAELSTGVTEWKSLAARESVSVMV